MTDESHISKPNATEQVQLLFVRHEGVIRAFVRALQPSLPDADDIMQETFLTISRKAETYELGTNFVAWAFSIARLKALENIRQRKRATVLSEAAIVALTEGSPSLDMMTEREQALEQCVEQLNPKMRTLLWRRYSTRQSSEEMASETGMTSIAVRVALTKARAFLRNCVGAKLQNSLES